ncbi:MAG TPA: phosphatase PAP2 family protein [Sphingomicrobium sp.]|nr:phosphatase PAP2 family protein [Sphingomicrobium sp.]
MSRVPDSSAAKLAHAIALLLFALIWMGMLLFGSGPLDRSVYQALYAGGHPTLVLAARIFTALGEPTVLISAGFIVAAWLWHRGRGRFALGLLLVILVGRGLSEIQKYSIARARPTLEPHLVVVKTSSFPSGHATSSMIFYLTLALALVPSGHPRRLAAGAAILLSLLIGTSRVLLGVHWPSDVIGGWSFGLLWVLLTLRRAERLFGNDSPPLLERL